VTSEAQRLARFVSTETGLACHVQHGIDPDGDQRFLLRPAGVPTDYAFSVRTTIRWRRIVVTFEPGRFAGDLLLAMGGADATGRTAFRTVLRECSNRGAGVEFRVNGQACDPEEEETWPKRWTRVSLTLKSQFEPTGEESEPGFADALEWSRLGMAAVVALLPMESEEPEEPASVLGFPEGEASIQRITRYERDRRNRAAAIAIWGSKCQACGVDFGARYGEVADGFIEVHHTTPVSKMEPGTIVNPARDLVPLCPNCHAVAHRRDPPFSVQEIRGMLGCHE